MRTFARLVEIDPAARYARLDAAEQSEKAWVTILKLEEKAYCEPSLLDSGDHMMAKGIVRKG